MYAYKNLLHGHVRVWNELGQTVESDNLVVYNGGDILIKLLAGDATYKVGYIYFIYENTVGVPVPMVPARTDTASMFHALVAPRDFVRAGVINPPVFSASDGDHLYNQATFLAIASATVGVLGVPFGVASNSKVFGLAMVAAPTGVYTGDLLYAHYSLPTPIAAAGSGQISASWMAEAD